MTTSTYTIAGMTCDNCRRHVTEALQGLPGVSRVDVSLEGGTAAIVSSAPLDANAVRTALEEAGYSLA
jgi:copper chaperone CopZ